MKTRVILAIVVSVLLIGFAIWYRFDTTKNTSGTLILESRGGEINLVEYKQNQTSENLNLLLSTSTSPLTKTETLGRGLISDYINMAINGQATPDGLAQLANDYVENVTLLDTANQISSFDVKTTNSTRANLSLYAQQVEGIIREHSLAITTIYSSTPKTGSEEEVYELGTRVGVVCGSTANKLKQMLIPTAVLDPHVQLINLYLECEGAMKSLSKAIEDPAKSFSGLVNLSSIASSEKDLLNKIEAILIKNGI